MAENGTRFDIASDYVFHILVPVLGQLKMLFFIFLIIYCVSEPKGQAFTAVRFRIFLHRAKNLPRSTKFSFLYRFIIEIHSFIIDLI